MDLPLAPVAGVITGNLKLSTRFKTIISQLPLGNSYYIRVNNILFDNTKNFVTIYFIFNPHNSFFSNNQLSSYRVSIVLSDPWYSFSYDYYSHLVNMFANIPDENLLSSIRMLSSYQPKQISIPFNINIPLGNHDMRRLSLRHEHRITNNIGDGPMLSNIAPFIYFPLGHHYRNGEDFGRDNSSQFTHYSSYHHTDLYNAPPFNGEKIINEWFTNFFSFLVFMPGSLWLSSANYPIEDEDVLELPLINFKNFEGRSSIKYRYSKSGTIILDVVIPSLTGNPRDLAMARFYPVFYSNKSIIVINGRSSFEQRYYKHVPVSNHSLISIQGCTPAPICARYCHFKENFPYKYNQDRIRFLRANYHFGGSYGVDEIYFYNFPSLTYVLPWCNFDVLINCYSKKNIFPTHCQFVICSLDNNITSGPLSSFDLCSLVHEYFSGRSLNSLVLKVVLPDTNNEFPLLFTKYGDVNFLNYHSSSWKGYLRKTIFPYKGQSLLEFYQSLENRKKLIKPVYDGMYQTSFIVMLTSYFIYLLSFFITPRAKPKLTRLDSLDFHLSLF